MKNIFIATFLMCSMVLFAQKDTLIGQVFSLKNLPQTVDSSRILTSILRGSATNTLENLRIHYSTLKPKHKLRPSHIQKNDEELIIVREGKLTVTINKKTKTIGAGSILLIMPGDEQVMNNLDTSDVSYYVFIYHSKLPQDSVRADTSGGSLILDWKDTAFKTQPISLQARRAQLNALKTAGMSAPDNLSVITQPVFVANGDNDLMVDSSHSADMARRLPNAKLTIYPDSGHGGVFQHHRSFVPAVLDFLAD